MITTSDTHFKITGSVAYNQDRTSLYISNIEFLEEDNTIYQELSYAVFEDYQYKIIHIKIHTTYQFIFYNYQK